MPYGLSRWMLELLMFSLKLSRFLVWRFPHFQRKSPIIRNQENHGHPNSWSQKLSPKFRHPRQFFETKFSKVVNQNNLKTTRRSTKKMGGLKGLVGYSPLFPPLLHIKSQWPDLLLPALHRQHEVLLTTNLAVGLTGCLAIV